VRGIDGHDGIVFVHVVILVLVDAAQDSPAESRLRWGLTRLAKAARSFLIGSIAAGVADPGPARPP